MTRDRIQQGPVLTDRWTDAVTIATRVNAGVVSATSVVAAALDRWDVLDPTICAFVDVWRQRAFDVAAEVDRRVAAGERPALAGVPIGIKASEGVTSLQAHRLVGAGCVPLGATAVPGAGTPWRTWGHTAAGPTRNPWRLDRSPGGSSAGSAAAVADGIVPLATASDGAGSTRIPAAWCGLIGVKPTNGRLPARDRAGMTVGGPLARSVADAVAYLEAVCGRACIDETPTAPWPLRAVWSPDLGFADVDPAVVAVVRSVADKLATAGILTWIDRDIQLRDPAPVWLTRRSGGDAQTTLAANDAELADVFAEADVLVTPTTPNIAHGHSGPGGQMSVALTWAFNISGHPAASIPTGERVDGCPVGLQLVAPHHHEPWLLRVARAAERLEFWGASR